MLLLYAVCCCQLVASKAAIPDCSAYFASMRQGIKRIGLVKIFLF